MPQEVCGLRELLSSLGELGVKVEYRFITPGVGEGGASEHLVPDVGADSVRGGGVRGGEGREG